MDRYSGRSSLRGAGPLTATTKAQRSVPRLTASASESKVDWLAEKRHHTSASVLPPPAANIVSSKDLALANGDAQQAIELLVANFAEKEPLWMVKPAKAAPPARPWVLVQGRRRSSLSDLAGRCVRSRVLELRTMPLTRGGEPTGCRPRAGRAARCG